MIICVKELLFLCSNEGQGLEVPWKKAPCLNCLPLFPADSRVRSCVIDLHLYLLKVHWWPGPQQNKW